MGKTRDKKQDEQNGFGAWGNYIEAKKAKLNEQYQEITLKNTEKLSEIFKGVSIFVNGLTSPSADELKELMAAHGGLYHTYQYSNTTHIIASNLPNFKINKLGSLPIVKPNWITDSIENGKLLNFRPYLLYTKQSTTQPKIDFPPKMVTSAPYNCKTASDPNFLNEFYNNSRLHLISTLGAEFKQLITNLREMPEENSFSGLEDLPENSPDFVDFTGKIIMHIDMDCFFVSVGLRKRPDLVGTPVCVTHARNGQIPTNENRDRQQEFDLYKRDGGNTRKIMEINGNSSMSEIASCSYEARKFGVKNGMFLGTAVKLCPQLVTIPYDFQAYREVSHILYKTITTYTLDIEAVSCDEMYVDVTEILKNRKISVNTFARHIRRMISEKTKCPCSTGFGANRLQARLATKRAKPNNQFHLKESEVMEFFEKIPPSDLPSVGHATLFKLNKLGLKTCKDIQNCRLDLLKFEFGPKIGENLKEMSFGRDSKPLNYLNERKSISCEINYGIRFETNEDCVNFLKKLSNELFERLNLNKMRANCLTLKLMVRNRNAPIETAKYLGHGYCDCLSKNVNFLFDSSDVIFKYTKRLYDKFNVNCKDLRGIGLHLTKLEKIPKITKGITHFLNLTKSKNVEEKSICQFFKAKKDNCVRTQSKLESTIDLNVLNELPIEIREEIINEYQIAQTIEENNVKSTKTENPFRNIPLGQFREILSNWLEMENEPKTIDMEMLSTHLKELAIERKIENLQIIFNFFHRKLIEKSCRWHHVYYQITNKTQEGMVARYGTTLKVNNFYCCQNTG